MVYLMRTNTSKAMVVHITHLAACQLHPSACAGVEVRRTSHNLSGEPL